MREEEEAVAGLVSALRAPFRWDVSPGDRPSAAWDAGWAEKDPALWELRCRFLPERFFCAPFRKDGSPGVLFQTLVLLRAGRAPRRGSGPAGWGRSPVCQPALPEPPLSLRDF